MIITDMQMQSTFQNVTKTLFLLLNRPWPPVVSVETSILYHLFLNITKVV